MGIVTMAILDAAYSVVRFRSYTALRTQYDRPSCVKMYSAMNSLIVSTGILSPFVMNWTVRFY